MKMKTIFCPSNAFITTQMVIIIWSQANTWVQQDRPCTYNITLWGVRVTIVVTDTQQCLYRKPTDGASCGRPLSNFIGSDIIWRETLSFRAGPYKIFWKECYFLCVVWRIPAHIWIETRYSKYRSATLTGKARTESWDIKQKFATITSVIAA
jgi:hypothetical protein